MRRAAGTAAVVLAVLAGLAGLTGLTTRGGVTASAPAPPTAAPTTVAPTTVAPTTVAPTTTTTLFALDGDAVRDAKIGWARFVADNFAVPTSVPDPCPLLAPEVLTGALGAVGLTPTDLPFGVTLYNDAVGAGVTGIRCGVDLSRSPTPSGATSYAVEVTVLDGQATFPQYVVRVAGNNTPIVQAPDLGGEVISRCRNEPRQCLASWHARGLIVTVRLAGPRTDDSEAQVGRLLAALVRLVVANVSTVPVP